MDSDKEVMLNGQTSAFPTILDRAANNYLGQLGAPYPDSRSLFAALKTDSVARYQFAPYLIQATMDALYATEPWGESAAFQEAFKTYVGQTQQMTAQKTLAAWKEFKAGKPITNNAPLRPVIGAKPGASVGDFLPLQNPFFIGDPGLAAIQLLYVPMFAASMPIFDGGLVARMGKTFQETVIKKTVGIGVGMELTLIALFGFVIIGQKYMTIRMDRIGNARIRAQATEELSDEWRIANRLFGNDAPLLIDVGEAEAGELEAGAEAVEAGATFSEVIANAVEAGGELLTALGEIPGAGWAALAVGTALVGGASYYVHHVLETGEFEASLEKDAANAPVINLPDLLKVDSTDESVKKFAKLTAVTYLMKMLVADPADKQLTTLDLPLDAVTGFVKSSILQFWANGSDLAAIQYERSKDGWQLSPKNGNVGGGSSNITALIPVSPTASGTTKIAHAWNRTSMLSMILYSPDANGDGYVKSWSTERFFDPTNKQVEGPWAVEYLAADLHGNGRDEILQLWNDNGSLSAVIYQPHVSTKMNTHTWGYKVGWGKSGMGTYVNGDKFVTTNMSTDKSTQLVQITVAEQQLEVKIYDRETKIDKKGYTIRGYKQASGPSYFGKLGPGPTQMDILVTDLQGSGKEELVRPYFDDEGVLRYTLNVSAEPLRPTVQYQSSDGVLDETPAWKRTDWNRWLVVSDTNGTRMKSNIVNISCPAPELKLVMSVYAANVNGEGFTKIATSRVGGQSGGVNPFTPDQLVEANSKWFAINLDPIFSKSTVIVNVSNRYSSPSISEYIRDGQGFKHNREDNFREEGWGHINFFQAEALVLQYPT